MEEDNANPVNTEVFRFLQEVGVKEQDAFLRGVVAHIRSIEAPTTQDVQEFFNKIWKGALAHELSAKRQLGDDYC